MRTSPAYLTAYCSVRRLDAQRQPAPQSLEFQSDSVRIHDDVRTALAKLGIDAAVADGVVAQLDPFVAGEGERPARSFAEGVSVETQDTGGERVVLYVNQYNRQLQEVFDKRYRGGEPLPQLSDPVVDDEVVEGTKKGAWPASAA